MRLAIVAGAVVLALSSCDWMERAAPAPRADRNARLEQIRKACASRLTYARLKEYVFDQAERISSSDPRRLDTLAAYSVARMDYPVVKSRDEGLNVTVCTGRFVLNLPPGIQDAFDGRPVIAADVEYAAQAAADGSGLVYSMSGAEPIIYRIATLGLPTRPLPQIAAAPAAAERKEEAADIPVARARPERQLAMPASVQEAKRTIAAAPEQRRPARASEEFVRPTKVAASPSFNCKHAKTGSEKMVCGSGSLAAADRRMSAVFYSEMASADAEAKRALRRTRDQFLARRERCSTEDCVARIYAERVMEIRRIANQ